MSAGTSHCHSASKTAQTLVSGLLCTWQDFHEGLELSKDKKDKDCASPQP